MGKECSRLKHTSQLLIVTFHLQMIQDKNAYTLIYLFIYLFIVLKVCRIQKNFSFNTPTAGVG